MLAIHLRWLRSSEERPGPLAKASADDMVSGSKRDEDEQAGEGERETQPKSGGDVQRRRAQPRGLRKVERFEQESGTRVGEIFGQK